MRLDVQDVPDSMNVYAESYNERLYMLLVVPKFPSVVRERSVAVGPTRALEIEGWSETLDVGSRFTCMT